MIDWFEEVEDWMLYGPLAEEEGESKKKQIEEEEEWREENSDNDIV